MTIAHACGGKRGTAGLYSCVSVSYESSLDLNDMNGFLKDKFHIFITVCNWKDDFINTIQGLNITQIPRLRVKQPLAWIVIETDW